MDPRMSAKTNDKCGEALENFWDRLKNIGTSLKELFLELLRYREVEIKLGNLLFGYFLKL